MRILLSLSYAYMGYVVFYAWNISWLDGVFLLPLMYTGVHKLLKGGKPYLYIFSLSIAIISNFYIGYMLGIASVLFYCTYVLLKSDQFLSTIKGSLGKYVLFTGIAVGISCFLLIPAYLGLPKTRSVSLIQILKEMYLNCNPSEIISGLFSGQVNSLDTNSPLIYCGILPVIFVVLFFINKEIELRRKIIYDLLIFIFLISFSNSFINIIWHGLSVNAWFNYRYSFIFSFVLLIIAYESYFSILSLDNVNRRNLIIQSLLFIFIALIFVLENVSDKNSFLLITVDIVVIILSFIISFLQIKLYK